MSLADLRDIAVIILAAFFIVQTVAVIVLAIILIKLMMEVRDKADSILMSTQRTVQGINGTANFVGDTVAKPIIRGISFASGVRRTVRALAGNSRRERR